MNEMRKLMEAVRRINEGAETAYYFEHYPHYMGTKNSKFATKINTIDEIHDVYLSEKDLGYSDKTWYESLDALGHSYAFADIIREWPAIRKELETKGVWAGQWEEGSHAISMESMNDAGEEVRKIEAQVAIDTGDWGDDDGDY
jgi:hypothetical protein